MIYYDFHNLQYKLKQMWVWRCLPQKTLLSDIRDACDANFTTKDQCAYVKICFSLKKEKVELHATH